MPKKAKAKKVAPKKVLENKKEKVVENLLDLRDENKEPAVPTKEKKVKKFSIKKILSIFAILTILVNLIFAYGIYVAGWTNTWTKTFVKIFPYPAAKVGWSFVSMNEYYKDLDSFVTYYKTVQKIDFSTDENKQVLKDLKKDILDRLMDQEAVSKEAKKMKLSVSKEDIENEYSRLVKESGEETLKKNIKDYYNWDVKTFKNEIKKALLQKKLEEAVRKDETINEKQKKTAEDILTKVNAGEDFANLAKELSESTDSTDGGNMGWFAKGTYDESYENQFFNLEKGQISDIIQAEEGFEIIKIEDRKENEILARHILIKYVDFKDWLSGKKNEYGTQKFIDTEKVKI
ncbi:hypothetical protein HGB13_00655 [bacterium]|nr:hypothetical protein [bacterium]